MQVDYQDLEVLLEIQKLDLGVIKAKKLRAELPQRIEVMKVRKKRDTIAPKLDQVIALQESKESEIVKVQDEDRGLAERQERVQEDIDNSSADFRAVESYSKDMAGIVKRRVVLEETLNGLNAELDKIKGVRAQIDEALAICDKQEEDLRSAYKEQDDELKEQIRGLLTEKDKLVAGIPAELAELYEDTAAKQGGVAIGRLDGEKCGVCRSRIEGGHLIELKANAPLGRCPNCKRLLIVE